MNDDPRANADDPPQEEREELNPHEQEQISGGLKGESTDAEHKDWIG